MGLLVNAQKTGAVLGLNPWTIRRLAAKGSIKVYRCGKAVRFDPDEVREWMRGQGEDRPTIKRHQNNENAGEDKA